MIEGEKLADGISVLVVIFAAEVGTAEVCVAVERT